MQIVFSTGYPTGCRNFESAVLKGKENNDVSSEKNSDNLGIL
jgi:hypothetical protein